MSGNEISVIPQSTHLTTIYGGAVDLVSPDGPFLWIHDQTAVGGGDLVVQLELPSGNPTGVVYDYNLSGQPAGNTGIAGGLFITDELVQDTSVIIGVSQGTPSDQLFVLELFEDVIAGVNDNSIANFNLYPNPANGIVNIQTKLSGEKSIVIYDVLGKQVLSTILSGDELNISELKAGVYMISVTQNNATATKKLVVQ
ncbi:T9SS type A sorting domain-containing protein [Aequorivita echinoideorum]|uniref:T9SS type A sorting domain-containing protein n=2 Tax=Aequorivita echinoideorum TaxID=1549647 RepID=A0ABS5S166_9FLAO|nr:T9SS type A sorting domain-containing protein [Aequorivita echinoideorum]